VANGDSDRIVPSKNTIDLAERLPNGELVPLYPDSVGIGVRGAWPGIGAERSAGG
jgi:hypothetical protein